jgi:peptide-methionine (R)-S-oxide reductase
MACISSYRSNTRDAHYPRNNNTSSIVFADRMGWAFKPVNSEISIMMITRRFVLAGGAVGLGASAFVPGWLAHATEDKPETAAIFPVSYSEAEWRQRLTPDQFAVLRRSATERPFTSPLLHEARTGTFTCAGCSQNLFSSTTKYDSHTGWPSFWAALDKGVGRSSDTSFGTVRTAVHCARCGGHLGHVFNDGPKPTGLRYCMNGIAMGFKPDAA